MSDPFRIVVATEGGDGDIEISEIVAVIKGSLPNDGRKKSEISDCTTARVGHHGPLWWMSIRITERGFEPMTLSEWLTNPPHLSTFLEAWTERRIQQLSRIHGASNKWLIEMMPPRAGRIKTNASAVIATPPAAVQPVTTPGWGKWS